MEEKLPVQKKDTIGSKLSALLRDKWPEYVIEVIVIIFSISISFALDEWKDTRKKQELEQFYLKELAHDIETDTNQLREIIAETRQIVQKARNLQHTEAATQSSYTGVLSDMRFIFKRPRFVAQDATFSDLKSTGNMQTLSSFALKNALFDYYKQYESINLIEAAELETTNTLVAAFVVKRLPLADGNKANQQPNLAALFREIEFQNGLLIRETTRQELLHNYERTLKHGQKILASIKSQLK